MTNGPLENVQYPGKSPLVRRDQNLLLLMVVLIALVLILLTNVYPGWNRLKSEQREMLEPVKSMWDDLSFAQRARLIISAERFAHSTEEQRNRFLERLPRWMELSGEDRNRARQMYLEFSRLSDAERALVKQKWEMFSAHESEMTYAGDEIGEDAPGDHASSRTEVDENVSSPDGFEQKPIEPLPDDGRK
jgi:hypothetical protein